MNTFSVSTHYTTIQDRNNAYIFRFPRDIFRRRQLTGVLHLRAIVVRHCLQ